MYFPDCMCTGIGLEATREQNCRALEKPQLEGYELRCWNRTSALYPFQNSSLAAVVSWMDRRKSSSASGRE